MSDGKATAQSFDPQERRRYLGASEIAAVMSLDRYKTPLDVYGEKRGIIEPFAGNRHTERGNALEAIAADYFTKQTGLQVRRRTEAFIHPEHPFIVGHIDRVIVGEKHLLEIKAPSIAAFRKFQREGLPESYVIQANVYMGLSGYPKLTFCIFCADAWDAATFTLDFDQTIYDAAIKAAVTFWTEHVQTGLAPLDEPGVADMAEIFKHGGSVTGRDDDAFVAFAQELREAQQLKADAEELLEIVKAKGIDLVEGECGIYEGGGLRLHYTEQAGRKTFDKKALAAAHPEIDLSRFEKQGKPFKTFRPFFITNTGA